MARNNTTNTNDEMVAAAIHDMKKEALERFRILGLLNEASRYLTEFEAAHGDDTREPIRKALDRVNGARWYLGAPVNEARWPGSEGEADD